MKKKAAIEAIQKAVAHWYLFERKVSYKEIANKILSLPEVAEYFKEGK